MADDKRNRGDQPQGDNQGPDRQRSRDRNKPGSGSIESPESPPTRREEEREPQE
jgi:hypothetical protein